MSERIEDLDEKITKLDKQFYEIKKQISSPNLSQKTNHELHLKLGDIKNEMITTFFRIQTLRLKTNEVLNQEQMTMLQALIGLCNKTQPKNIEILTFLKLIAPKFNHFQSRTTTQGKCQ